jgi:hypothetical protein
MDGSASPACGVLANIPAPSPVPPGHYGPIERPVEVPSPEEIAPHIQDPAPEPMLPIREPGAIRLPQAACLLTACARRLH